MKDFIKKNVSVHFNLKDSDNYKAELQQELTEIIYQYTNANVDGIMGKWLPSFIGATLNTFSTQGYAVHTLIINCEHDEYYTPEELNWECLKGNLTQDLFALLDLDCTTDTAKGLNIEKIDDDCIRYTIVITAIENF